MMNPPKPPRNPKPQIHKLLLLLPNIIIHKERRLEYPVVVVDDFRSTTTAAATLPPVSPPPSSPFSWADWRVNLRVAPINPQGAHYLSDCSSIACVEVDRDLWAPHARHLN